MSTTRLLTIVSLVVSLAACKARDADVSDLRAGASVKPARVKQTVCEGSGYLVEIFNDGLASVTGPQNFTLFERDSHPSGLPYYSGDGAELLVDGANSTLGIQADLIVVSCQAVGDVSSGGWSFDHGGPINPSWTMFACNGDAGISMGMNFVAYQGLEMDRVRYEQRQYETWQLQLGRLASYRGASEATLDFSGDPALAALGRIALEGYVDRLNAVLQGTASSGEEIIARAASLDPSSARFKLRIVAPGTGIDRQVSCWPQPQGFFQ